MTNTTGWAYTVLDVTREGPTKMDGQFNGGTVRYWYMVLRSFDVKKFRLAILAEK